MSERDDREDGATEGELGPGAAESDEVRIKFPCLYPIKIIGRADKGFKKTVVRVVEGHTGKISRDLIATRYSEQGNYLSVTVTIAAQDEDQLRAIFHNLRALPAVKMVL